MNDETAREALQGYPVQEGQIFYPTAMLGAGTSATSYMVSGGYSTMGFVTPSGTEIGVKIQSKDKSISPSLYIKFVKSKLGKVEQNKVKRRMEKVKKMIAYSKEIGQRALYEELCKEIAVLLRESELDAYGINTWVNKEDIEKFRGIVKDKVIKFDKMEKFPRVIPKSVQSKIKKLEAAKVVESGEFWILYIDYTKQPDLKTTKEKIRNKDPILFVEFSHNPGKFYYVADWVDEYCDLTLDKFIEKFKEKDPEFGVNEIKDVDEDRWKEIIVEVKERQKRLETTYSGNWRDREKEEADSKSTKLKSGVTEEHVNSFWKRVFSRKKK